MVAEKKTAKQVVEQWRAWKKKKRNQSFPLTVNANGQWMKKFKNQETGKWEPVYFGPLDSPEAARKRYEEEEPFLRAGKTPPRLDAGAVTVAQMCANFLASKSLKLQTGSIKLRTYQDYQGTCDLLLGYFGEGHNVMDLSPRDFESLLAYMQSKLNWGVHRVGNFVNQIRMVFTYAYNSDLVDKPIKWGEEFKRPPKASYRQSKYEKGRSVFTSDEMLAILDAASVKIKAMVLLGINCGLGNTDIGALTFGDLEYLDEGWLNYPRRKTWIFRRLPLWPETVQAIKDYLAVRKEPKPDQNQEMVFVTKRGYNFVRDGKDNPLSAEFRKLTKRVYVDVKKGGKKRRARVYQASLTFYSLRRTFRTVCGYMNSNAARAMMGHAAESDAASAARGEMTAMDEVYVGDLGDNNLREVANFLRSWLYGKPEAEKKAKRKTKKKATKKKAKKKVAAKE